MQAGISVKIPGKVLVAGEYAVLHGGEALAATVDRYLRVELQPGVGEQILMSSDLWEESVVFTPNLDVNRLSEKYRAFAWCIWHIYQYYGSAILGTHFQVFSGWAISDGLGSSSALRLGLWRAARHWVVVGEGLRLDEAFHEDTVRRAYLTQKHAQGVGSGYDVLTQSVTGWVWMQLDFDHWPGQFKRCPGICHAGQLQLFTGGAGTETSGQTKQVMQSVQQYGLLPALRRAQSRWIRLLLQPYASEEEVCAQMGACRRVLEGTAYLDHALLKLQTMSGCDQYWSFKPTGAGGLDALLVFAPAQMSCEAREFLASLGYTPSGLQLGVMQTEGW